MAGHPHLYSGLSCSMGPTALRVSRDTIFTQFMKEWRPHYVCVCACGVMYVLVSVCVAAHLPISVLCMCVCVCILWNIYFLVYVLQCIHLLMCASMWVVEYALVSVFVHESHGICTCVLCMCLWGRAEVNTGWLSFIGFYILLFSLRWVSHWTHQLIANQFG